MKITQTCGKGCPNHHSLTAQGEVLALSLWSDRLMIDGRRCGEYCSQCGNVVVWIAEDEEYRSAKETSHEAQ